MLCFVFLATGKENAELSSNEWFTCKLLQEKNTEKFEKMGKKIEPTLYETRGIPPDLDWKGYELLLGNKKNTVCIFF